MATTLEGSEHLSSSDPGSESPTQVRVGRRTTDLVFRYLQRRIISGELGAGERIDINEVARLLEVSRTPVREALLQLETEGLVDRRPYRGTVVRGVDMGFVAETYALRLYLESLAAQVGASRLTDDDLESMRVTLKKLASVKKEADPHRSFNQLNREFHGVLARAADSDQLGRYLNTLGGQGERLRMHFDLKQNPAVHSQHVAIYEACRTRDPEQVVKAVRLHIIQTASALLPTGYAFSGAAAILPAVLTPEETQLMTKSIAARHPKSGSPRG